MSERDRNREPQRLRRMLWNTLLGWKGSGSLAEEVLVPLLDEHHDARTSLLWWRLAPNEHSERARRTLVAELFAALDHDDRYAAEFAARVVDEMSADASPGAAAHVYTVEYLWRSITSSPRSATRADPPPQVELS